MCYEAWTALLADIVTPDGKVDYERLAERRPRLSTLAAIMDELPAPAVEA